MPKRKAPRAKKSKPAEKNKKKKPAPPKKAARTQTPPRRKLAGKKAPAPRRKPARAKAPAARRTATPAPRRKPAGRQRASARERTSSAAEVTPPYRSGAGPDSGGQSGDIEGLTGVADADSESVEELAEEGQDFEAEIVDAVENAPDPDQGEVKTREVPEDDVPDEYKDDKGNR